MKNLSKKEKFREEKRKDKLKKRIIFWSIIIILFSGLSYWIIQSANKQPNFLNPDVDLTQVPSGQIHWHPKLEIKMNGENIIIPNNIGLAPGAHSPTHTHDEGDGTIHLENQNPINTPESMSIGYFFNIWKQPFNETCILDKCTNTDGGKLTMYVNDKVNTEYENYLWKEEDVVRIEYTN